MILTINDAAFETKAETLSGAQIAAMIGKDVAYEVWLLRPTPDLDLFVPTSSTVVLREGLRFSVIPSTPSSTRRPTVDEIPW